MASEGRKTKTENKIFKNPKEKQGENIGLK